MQEGKLSKATGLARMKLDAEVSGLPYNSTAALEEALTVEDKSP